MRSAMPLLAQKNKSLYLIGNTLKIMFSIACGIINASALIILNIFGGGVFTYILAAILFCAVVAMNIKMLRNSVPEILIKMFGNDRFFQGFTETTDGQPLSTIKKIAMLFGFILALAAGATFGVLAYSSTFSLITAFSILGALSVAFPPIAVFFAAITLVCMTALMLDAIVKVIQMDNMIKKAKLFLYDLIDTNPLLLRNINKSHGRIVIERAMTLLLTTIALPLAAVGLYMTMNACSIGLSALLTKVPHAMAGAVDVAAKFIVFGLALIGQIPFIFRNAVLLVKNLFEQTLTIPASYKMTFWDNIKSLCIQVLRLIFATGNGLVSMLGAGSGLAQGLAASGGIFNSISSTADNEQLPANHHDYSSSNCANDIIKPVSLKRSASEKTLYSIKNKNKFFSDSLDKSALDKVPTNAAWAQRSEAQAVKLILVI